MTKKRFIEFNVTTNDDSEILCGFKDTQTDKYYYTKDIKNAKESIILLNELSDENIKLKKQIISLQKQ